METLLLCNSIFVCHFSQSATAFSNKYILRRFELKSPKMRAVSILEISAQSAVACIYAKVLRRFGWNDKQNYQKMCTNRSLFKEGTLDSVAQHGIQRGWLLTAISQHGAPETQAASKLSGIQYHHAPQQPPPCVTCFAWFHNVPSLKRRGTRTRRLKGWRIPRMP